MPTFPHTTNTGVFVYHLSRAKGGTLPNAEKARLRDLLHDRVLARRAPKDLDHPNGEVADDVWGWYYPDSGDLGHVGHLLTWGRRTWTKRADPGLLKASIDDQRAELQRMMEQEIEDYKSKERTPPYKELRAELNEKLDAFKEAQEQALRLRAQPKVREDGILLDDEHKRLVLFAASASQRDSLIYALRRILGALYRADDLLIEPWSLSHYLGRARAKHALPADVGPRFLGWLARHAGTTWMEASERGATVEANDVLETFLEDQRWFVQVELGEQAVAETDDGKITAKGSDAVLELIADEDCTERLERLELIVGEPALGAEQRWSILVDAEGRPLKVKLLHSADKAPSNEDGGIYLRGAALLRAHDALVVLVAAWDWSDLHELLQTAPQVGLFPLAPVMPGRWINAKGVPRADGAGDGPLLAAMKGER